MGYAWGPANSAPVDVVSSKFVRMPFSGGPLRPVRATLFLMDRQFQPVRALFELSGFCWVPARRDLGCLADWAVLPVDAPLPRSDRAPAFDP